MLTIPTYSERSIAGIIQQDIFSTLLSERIIMLFGEIDRNAAEVVIAQLLFLEAKNPSAEIRIYINSPGGSVIDGLAIYDTMKHIKCDISTLCVGEAASMGAFLLAAGTKGKRYALENSTIMIHQALGAIPFSQASDISIQADRIASEKSRLNTLLARMTGKSLQQIERDTDRDFYLSAGKAAEYGLIDGVISDE